MSDSDSKCSSKSNLQRLFGQISALRCCLSHRSSLFAQIMAAPKEVDAGKPAANKPADPLQYWKTVAIALAVRQIL